jgi:hypothetical protein
MICASSEFGGPLRMAQSNILITAFYSLSSLLQIIITGMITTKLVRVHRQMDRRNENTKRISSLYVSIISVLAESAALFTIASIVFFALLNTNSNAQIWWGQLLTSLSASSLRLQMITNGMLISCLGSSCPQRGSFFVWRWVHRTREAATLILLRKGHLHPT